MFLTEYAIQYTTQKASKGSVLADQLARQAVDDYQSMNFEFPDENIMVVTDCETPGPDEGPGATVDFCPSIIDFQAFEQLDEQTSSAWLETWHGWSW